MIKKYFAMTVVAASVALAGCSSDDDDDDGGDSMATAPTLEECTADPSVDQCATLFPETQPPAGPTLAECTADPTIEQCDTLFPGTQPVELTAEASDPAVTVYDNIAASTVHTALLATLNANPVLANAADDENAPITVLAPDDTAFAAVVAATDGVETAEELITALTTDDPETTDVDESQALLRILQYHVMGGANAIDLTAVVAEGAEPTPTLLADAPLSFAATTTDPAAPTGVDVIDSTGTPVAMTEAFNDAGGTLYSIGTVLTPPAAEPTGGEGGGGGGGGGEAPTGTFADLVGDGYSTAVSALDTAFGNASVFDNAPWTLFLPSDAVLAAQTPPVTEIPTLVINGHLHTTALDPDALAAVASGSGTILTANNNGNSTPNELTITVDGAGAIFVNGIAATYIGEVAASEDGSTAGGAQVYMIDGVLPGLAE